MNTPETPRLLSVEDNRQTRVVLKHLLGGGYRLTFASGVESALDAVGCNRPFYLFLLDINLGACKNGTALPRLLRNREDTADVPAIALTAYAMPGDQEALLSEGFGAYVDKPSTRRDPLGHDRPGPQRHGTIGYSVSAMRTWKGDG